MAITRNSLNNPNLNDEQRNHIQQTLEKNMACDSWTCKALKNVGVLLTSHPNNRAFLKHSLLSHKRLEFWTTVFYDNYWAPSNEIRYESLMPGRDVFDLADNFFISKQQEWGGVIFPYFWMLKFGLQSLSMYDYVYHANGDCIIERPEGFENLLNEMGDEDFFPIGWDDTQSKPMCNTTGFVIRSKWIQPMMQHIQDHLIPFEVYEKYSAKLGSGEVRFAQAILDLGMKLKKPNRNPKNLQLSIPGGLWYDIIGFRHIHGEYKESLNSKNIGNIPWEYIDKRYL
jgi:hypothetical protein